MSDSNRYEVPDNLWVSWQVGSAGQGCGNHSIYAMRVGAEVTKDRNPFCDQVYWDHPVYRAQYQAGNSPGFGMRLRDMEAYLREKYRGREYSMTFVRYARATSTHPNVDAEGYAEHFEAYQMMLVLERNMSDVAFRTGDWFNTLHSPASHLRSYNLVIPGKDYATGKEYVVSDYHKQVF